MATEDQLSEDIAHRLVAQFAPEFEIALKFRKHGFGYLKANIDKFFTIAQRDRFLLITDLDNARCAATLISSWSSEPLPSNLLFRVAVREIEAWLLADHDAMRTLLVKGASKLPDIPDTLSDPKRFLLNCAARAPREVRLDLLVERDAIASQGLGFVRNTWNPSRAATRSDSLRRTINRLGQMSGDP